MSTAAPSSAKSVEGVLEEVSIHQNGSVSTIPHPASDAPISPRVSTAGGTDGDHHVSTSKSPTKESSGYASHGVADYTTPGLDSLHWAGVNRNARDFDQRSIASSMAAERDDKSIYEEPAVGAVEEAEEEVAEDIQLPQINATLADVTLQHGRDDQGNLRDDQGKSDTAAATAGTSYGAPSTEADAGSLRPTISEADEFDEVVLDARGAGSGDHHHDHHHDQTATPPAEGDMHLAGSLGQDSTSMAASPRSPGMPPSPVSRASADFELAPAYGSATSPTYGTGRTGSVSDGQQGTEHTMPVTQAMAIHPGEPPHRQRYQSTIMRDATGVYSGDSKYEAHRGGQQRDGGDEGVRRNDVDNGIDHDDEGEEGATDDDASSSTASMTATASPSNSLVGSLRKEDMHAVGSSPPRLVGAFPTSVNTGGEGDGDGDDVEPLRHPLARSAQQQGKENEDEDDLPAGVIVRPFSEAVAETHVHQEQEPEKEKENDQAEERQQQRQEGRGRNAALTAATSPPPPVPSSVAPEQQQRVPRVDMGLEWENTFRGLLYIDGVDALGRPVVVLNADAVPRNMRSSAVTYVKTHLEPLVNSGDYVMVFTARRAKLPTLWIMGAYQSLPRPYRKNVQYVLLVRPSAFLRAVLAFMRPFVSKKAGRKIKLVDNLEDLAEATGGEVTMYHLGQPFLEADAAEAEREAVLAASAAAAAAANP